MNNPKPIFIVGMPGVGKSYWAREVSSAYGLQLVDLDKQISIDSGMGVSEIFAKYGSDYFRERETASLLRIIQTAVQGALVSCGGGTPCYNDNMSLMKKAGVVIYLEASVPYLLSNIQKDGMASRPLLESGADVARALSSMLDEREQYYKQAHYILQAKDISIGIFEEILNDV